MFEFYSSSAGSGCIVYSCGMQRINPLKFAAWLALAGISFGAALGWGWLIVAGLIVPPVFLILWLIASVLR